MSIRRRGALDLRNFDHALIPDEGNVVTIDLSDTTFVDAYGLVGITCQILDAATQDRPVDFIGPVDPNVANYLSRMRLGELLRD